MEFEQITMNPTSSIIPDVPVTEKELGEEEVPTQELQQQPESIAIDRPRRQIKKPARFVDMVAYALPVVDDVPSTFLEVAESLENERWKD
ncbi:hypothetical protein L3055_11225, partial [Corynebacterium sp. MC-02]|nr:hypothetical protein [Corynebacterium pseudokroppenstedtii]